MQFGGAGSWNTTLSLQIEKHDYLKRIQKLREQLSAISQICLPGCDDMLIDSAIAATEGVVRQLEITKMRLYESLIQQISAILIKISAML